MTQRALVFLVLSTLGAASCGGNSPPADHDPCDGAGCGPAGNCDNAPCAHGACTATSSGFTCDCDDGFEGTTCNVNIDDCATSLCAHGTCVDGIATSTCSCDNHWSGALCDIPVESCADAPCVHGVCTDTSTDYICSCDAGYDGDNCDHDIDDCIVNTCTHGVCEDDVDAYHCACDAGYHSEGTTCADNDECTDTPTICGPHATCGNTDGGHTCDCDDGYDFDPLTQTCRALDACSEANGGCAHKCLGTAGFDPICACLPGFSLGSDGLACNGLDRVFVHSEPWLNDGSLQLDRTGTAPNYSIMIGRDGDPAVFAQAAGGYNHVSLTIYDRPGFCADGSKSLLCPDAYRLCTHVEEGFPSKAFTARKNGIVGVPANWDEPECTWIMTEVSATRYRLQSAADPDAGKLSITDPRQWYFDQGGDDVQTLTNLPEIDECVSGDNFCNRNATCTDVPWFYRCACNTGFSGNGFACDQTDMCAPAIDADDQLVVNGGCEQTCASVGSAAVCSCKLGYTLGADGKSCVQWTQGRITNLGLPGAWDGVYWQGSGRPVRLEATTDGPNTYHVTATKVPGTCADGLIRNECTDEYRLCVLGTDTRSSLKNAQVGTPSDWSSPRCTWMVEAVGGGQFRLKNLQFQQQQPYIDYLDCKFPFQCTFTIDESTQGNTLFQIEDDVCAAGISDCDPNATCTYHPGGHDCACKVGYDGDGFTCTQIDPCVVNNGGCEQLCINDNGAPLCDCYNGFTLDGNETSCTPQINVHLYNLGLSAFMGVAAGTFSFGAASPPVTIAKVGNAFTFTLSAGGHSYCLAADSGSPVPSLHVDPASTTGCTWLIEDTADGRIRLIPTTQSAYYLSCRETNECSFTPIPDEFATFVIDPDECAQGTDACDTHASCTNAADGYTCACDSGYTGDGRQCALQNGCVAANGGCAQTCSPTATTAVTCSCQPGFDLAGDGHNCVAWSQVRLFNSGLNLPLGVASNGVGQFLQFQQDAARVRMQPAAGAPNRFTFTAERSPGTCVDGSTSPACVDSFRLCAQSSSGYRWSMLRALDGRPPPAGWDDAACVWEVTNLGGGHVRLKNLWLQQTVPYADYLSCALPYDCTFTYNESVAGNTDFVIDRDECASGTSGCSQYATCANTAGSRTCVCNSGFSGNGVSCISDDPCFSGNGGCDQFCTDTGTATCSCSPGFSLAANGHTCNPSGPTLLFNDGLGAYLGAAVAEQPPYALNWAPRGDIVHIAPAPAFGNDAFTLTTDSTPGWCADGTVSAACVDHYRVCAVQRQGFRWDVKYASDYTGTPAAWTDAACAWHLEPAGGNKVRLKNVWAHDAYPYVDYLTCDLSYDCGFTYNNAQNGNTLFTVVTDECAAGTDLCSDQRACLPGPSGYTCGNCPAGYTNSGPHNCADIDECVQGTHGCDTHATCGNTTGGRTCSCNSGYAGNGVQCTPLGPCATTSCDQTCTVVAGAAQCGCLAGFGLGPDGASCNSVGLVSLRNMSLQKDLAVHAEGNPAAYPFVFRNAGDPVRMEPTADAANVFTFTVPFHPATCAGGNCQLDSYRLCAHQDGGFRSHALFRGATASPPSGWDDARCKWIVEPVGNDQVRLKNLWLQQSYPYVDYLNCWLEDDCVFTYDELTQGNTLFQITPSSGDALCQGVVCAAIDTCHTVGVCNPTTGACDNPIQGNGTPCGGINACSDGVCFPGGDDDSDGVANAADVCTGDDASNDQDADDFCDNLDVCPSISDSAQADADGDGIGDVCDKCPSVNAVTSNNDQDSDGVGDPCDPDFKLPGPPVVTTPMPWRPTCGFVPQCPGTPASSIYNSYLFGCLASEPDGGAACLSDRWQYLLKRRIYTGVPGVSPAGTEAFLDELEKPENNVPPTTCVTSATCAAGRTCEDGVCITPAVKSFIDRLSAASEFTSCTGASSYENTWPADRVITFENGGCKFKIQDVYGYRVVNTTNAPQTIWVGRGDSDADKRWWTLAPGENIKFNAVRTVKLFATTAAAYNVCQPSFMVRTVYPANLSPPVYSAIPLPLVRYSDGSGELVVYREKQLLRDPELADYPNYFNVGITYRDPSAFSGVIFRYNAKIKCNQVQ